MTDRDPRVNPQVGDVVKKTVGSKDVTRTVISRHGNDITYRIFSGAHKQCWITTWQDWCKNAEVVN